MAEKARKESLPWVGSALDALEQHHTAWIFNKTKWLEGKSIPREVKVCACAFRSNFNIDYRNPEYGEQHINVMSYLKN